MSKSSTTVRDVFELPDPGAEQSSGWKTFQDKAAKEVQGIKTAALPDMTKKIAELLDIPIPDIFLNSWKKAEGIQALLEESRQAPDTVMNAELGEHTINSQHQPNIEIRIGNKVVKKIEFMLKLGFNLRAFVLRIQDGSIKGMQSGLCELKGKLEYQGVVIAEKKLAPITLPGSIAFNQTEKRSLLETEEMPLQTTAPSQAPSVVAALPKADAVVTGATSEASKSIESVVAESAGRERPESFSEGVAGEDKQTRTTEGESQGREVEPLVHSQASDTAADAIHAMPPAATLLREPAVVEANEGRELISDAAQPAEGTSAMASPAAAVEDDDERMTWEVDDPEENVVTPPVSQASANDEIRSTGSGFVSSAQDVIDRMSRELADRRGSETEPKNLEDQAKAAS